MFYIGDRMKEAINKIEGTDSPIDLNEKTMKFDQISITFLHAGIRITYSYRGNPVYDSFVDERPMPGDSLEITNVVGKVEFELKSD